MNVVKVGIGLLFVICILLAYMSHIIDHITLENITIHQNYFVDLINSHYFFSIVTYISIYCLLVSLALPAAGVLSIAGGALLGTICATLCVCIAATIGATISFFMARYILRDIIEHRYGSWVEYLNSELIKHGYNYMLMLRLFPVTPFFIINPIAGLTRLPVWTFIWTTMIGILPGTIVFTAAGARMAVIRSTQDIFTLQTIFVLIGLTILAILPILIKPKKNMRLSKWENYEL